MPQSKNLKEDAKRDLKKGRVWFDDDEMAAYHDINGSKILCVLDRCETALAAVSSSRAATTRVGSEGLQLDLFILFIRADEYRGEPRVGQEICVDGRKYYIQPGCIEYDGVWEIVMKRVSPR